MSLKTVSLETAKKLKEAGFPQNTEFSWAESSSVAANQLVFKPYFASCLVKTWYAAITTSELLEQLTNEEIMEYAVFLGKATEEFSIKSCIDLFRDPDKLAECWIYVNQRKDGVK